MSGERINLSAVSGERKTVVTFNYRHILELPKAYMPNTGTLEVDGVPLQIPRGTTLKFSSPNDEDCCNCIEVVTASITAAYSPIVEVVPVNLQIPCGHFADVGPVDLSDRIYHAECRETDEDDSPILFEMPCVVSAAGGWVEVKVNLTNEPVNTEFGSIPSDLSELQTITKSSKVPAHRALIQRAYSWNLACQYTGSHPRAGDRDVEKIGYFWLVARGRTASGAQPLAFPTVNPGPSSTPLPTPTLDSSILTIQQANTFVPPCVVTRDATGWILAQANARATTDIHVCIQATPTSFTLGTGYRRFPNHAIGPDNALLMLSHLAPGGFVTGGLPVGAWRAFLGNVIDKDWILINQSLKIEEVA